MTLQQRCLRVAKARLYRHCTLEECLLVHNRDSHRKALLLATGVQVQAPALLKGLPLGPLADQRLFRVQRSTTINDHFDRKPICQRLACTPNITTVEHKRQKSSQNGTLKESFPTNSSPARPRPMAINGCEKPNTVRDSTEEPGNSRSATLQQRYLPLLLSLDSTIKKV